MGLGSYFLTGRADTSNKKEYDKFQVFIIVTNITWKLVSVFPTNAEANFPLLIF